MNRDASDTSHKKKNILLKGNEKRKNLKRYI